MEHIIEYKDTNTFKITIIIIEFIALFNIYLIHSWNFNINILSNLYFRNRNPRNTYSFLGAKLS